MFGYTRAELIGCDIVKLSSGVDPSTQERAIELLQEAASEGRQTFEWHGKTKNGVPFWVEISLRFAEFGEIPAVVAIVRDVDERRRVADKLREAQAALVEAQSVAHVGSFTVDLLNNHTTWSDECFRILGFDPATFIPSFESYLARIHPDDRATLAIAYKRSLEDRTPGGVKQRIVWGDGTVRVVQQQWQNYYGADGEALRTTGTIQDITERKNAEAALTVSDVLQAVIASIAALINNASLDEGAPQALRMIGEALNVDRCVVVENVDRPRARPNMIPTYRWNKSGLEPLLPPFVAEQIKHPDVLSWLAPLNEGKPVITTCVNANATVQGILSALKSTSILLIPIFVAGENWGHIGLNDSTPDRQWTAAEIEPLLALATLFGVIIERGRQNQALAQEQDLSAAVISSLPGIFVHFDESGRIVRCNENLSTVTGLSNEQLHGRDAFSLVADADRKRTQAKLADVLEKGHVEVEFGLLTKGGSVREFHWSARIITRDAQPHVLAVGIDMTEARAAEMKLREAQAALVEAQAIAHVGNWDIDQLTGRFSWSDQVFRIFGVDPQTFIPSLEAVLQRTHPEDRAMLGKAYADAVAALSVEKSQEVLSIDHRIVLDDGSIKIVQECGRMIYDDKGHPVRSFGTIQDVTERKIVENALRASEERFRTVSDTAQDAIIVIDSAAKISYWNPAAERILGYSAEEASGKLVHELLTPVRFREKAVAGMREFAATGRGNVLGKTLELAANRKDGTEIPIELSVARMRWGAGWHAVAMLRDISQRKLLEDELVRLARHDVLTGLPNRAVFVEALELAIAQADRNRKTFALLYLDLDHFKDVNDTLGHPIGDLLLQAIAQRLRASIRVTDTVARFGGDEFALINADVRDPADVVVLASKVLKAISKPFSIQGNEIRSGASIGIAIYGLDASDAETLLSRADVALYRAKAEGRGTYRFFTDAMDKEVQIRVKLTGELREAISSGQLFLMYQPQVNVDTRQIIGVEALARWRHPSRGIVMPGEFIPVAERSGLIVALGRWVLHEACRQMKEWLDAGIAPPLVAVNVSGLQFKKPLELEQDIAATLAETTLPPDRLELELTETSFMGTSGVHDGVLLRLRKTGLRIAIDDFGNGYSSLDYLSRYPVDRIKIAQNFVIDLTTGSSSATIVKAAIGMAHDLGLDVIVEGVETAEQLELIRSFNGHKVQGFYFSKPLAAADVEALLRTGKISPARVVAIEGAI
jgi:diguanylate cyclase (GGDEF)-like protein/PAS domain S-box-containing protein